MSKQLKGAALLLACGLGAAGLFFAALPIGIEWRLRQRPIVPQHVGVPARGDAVEGARLAAILGCRGCHGDDLGGRASCYEEAGRFSLVCPNLTQAREQYDDVALVTLLRYGRKRNGALVDFMPWDMYARLSDEDMGNVLAFVRAAPTVLGPPLPASKYSLATRLQMLWGEYPPRVDLDQYDSTPLSGQPKRGQYLASIACPECHAPSLRGFQGDDAPSLIVAKAYSAEAFTRLLREGITVTGSESRTGLMTMMARTRFKHFRQYEIDAIKAYLDQRAP